MGAMQQALLGTGAPFDGTFDGVAGADGSDSGFVVGSFGSITPTTFPWLSGGASTIRLLLCATAGGNFFFEVADAHANSGWTNLTVGGTSLNRADATYTSPGAYTRWVWAGTTNPFTNGVAFTAQFTQ